MNADNQPHEPWWNCEPAPRSRKGGAGNPPPTVCEEGGFPTAELLEGRGAAKENTHQLATDRTQSRAFVSNGLLRVREVARKDKDARFTALLHHLTTDLLCRSFYSLKRQASAGVDRVTWRQYEEGLVSNLERLCEQVHRGTYRALPSRRVYIPKSDGRQRPLGVAAMEDKIVQHATVTIRNQIYEEDVLGFSYGFRLGRSQHDALDALCVGLSKPVSWVLDADIQGFFDNLNHEWLLRFIEHRVADRRIVRLIRKWLRAGVLEDGRRIRTEKGTPQGVVVSPLLANIYLHYVLDVWVQKWRQTQADGYVMIVRYADDFVMGFQYHRDARRFLTDLRERMSTFGLVLHPEKTRLIEFGRFAAGSRRAKGQGKPETFDFLGFTHYCSRRKNGEGFVVRRKSIRKRAVETLKTIREQLHRHRHRSIVQQGQWLAAVLRGYFNYHAVPGNIETLKMFRRECARVWLHALRRRSQRHRMDWNRMARLVERYFPPARTLHPLPNVRFYANIQGRSRMR